MTDYEIHPAAAIFPEMSPAAYRELLEDVRANGVRVPLVLYQGKLIDGRNRLRACHELGIEAPTVEWSGDDVVAHVVALNLHRRHLTASQRAACAAEAAVQIQRAKAEREEAKQAARRALRRMADGAPPEVVVEVPHPEIPVGPSVAVAAPLFGASTRSTKRAKAILHEAPEVHEQVKAGKVSVVQAGRRIAAAKRRLAMDEAAAKVDPDAPRGWHLEQADVVEALDAMPPASADLVFADPPYNCGIDYGNGADSDDMTPSDYMKWVTAWMVSARRVLRPDGSIWVLIDEDYADYFGVALRMAGFHRRRWVVWHETFGVYSSDNFGRSARHLFYCVADPRDYHFDRDAVAVPSARQAIYNDKRADPRGRIVDNVWEIPRLTGTCAERIEGLPTQLPLELVRRAVLSTTAPGDLVVELFCGGAPAGVVSIESGRRYVGIESHGPTSALAARRLTAAMSSPRPAAPAADAPADAVPEMAAV